MLKARAAAQTERTAAVANYWTCLRRVRGGMRRHTSPGIVDKTTTRKINAHPFVLLGVEVDGVQKMHAKCRKKVTRAAQLGVRGSGLWEETGDPKGLGPVQQHAKCPDQEGRQQEDSAQ